MKQLLYLLLAFLFCISITSFAQNPEWIYYTNGDIVNALAEEGNEIWVGTSGGLVQIDKFSGTTTFYNTSNSGLPSNIVHSIAIDGSGNKWIGTNDGGLVRFDGTNWDVYNTSNSGLPDNSVLSIAIDGSGNKWIGTAGGGLARFDGVSIQEPNIVVSDDTLDFDQVFLGVTDTLTLEVSNTGTLDLLITSISADIPEYSVSPSFAGINSYESETFTVTFSPQTVGFYPGKLTIISNDPDSDTLIVILEGQGVEPPNISVSPDSLSIELFAGDSKTQSFTIFNMGGSDLNFDIFIGNQNYALQFDGLDDHIITGDSFFPEGSETRTITAWFRTSEDYNYESGTLFNYGIGTEEYQETYLSIENKGAGNVVQAGTGGHNSNIYGNSIVNDGNWHFVAATYDGSVWKLYVDGGVDEANYEGGISPPTNTVLTGITTIGCNVYFYEQYFNGTIDEIRIWNVAKTQAEIQSDMYREISGNESGLVGYWNFNEGSGTITFDQTTNNNHGTLNGGVTWIQSTAPILSWLSANPTTGTVHAGDSLEITVTFDATNLQSGVYNSDILISSNDPDESEIVVTVQLDVLTGLEDPAINKIPNTYTLFQNYPNPFNPSTIIKYGIPKESNVKVVVYNILGERLEILVNTIQKAGYYEINFNASKLPSGVYFYRIQAGNFIDTKKMVLLK